MTNLILSYFEIAKSIKLFNTPYLDGKKTGNRKTLYSTDLFNI